MATVTLPTHCPDDEFLAEIASMGIVHSHVELPYIEFTFVGPRPMIEKMIRDHWFEDVDESISLIED